MDIVVGKNKVFTYLFPYLHACSFRFKVNGTPQCCVRNFNKENTFCDFLFAFLGNKIF